MDLLSNATQFNGHKTKDVDVVIGFDLGTSSTKVVLQSPFAFDSHSILIPFNEYAHKSSNHLLPTVLYLNQNESFNLKSGDDSEALDNLKINLMDIANEGYKEGQRSKIKLTKIYAMAYISLVLRYVRTWFLNTQELYQQSNIHWMFNIGIPSKGYDDQSIKDLFYEIAYKAWYLSVEEGVIDYNKVEQLIDSNIDQITHSESMLHPDEISVIPEFAAEVVAYARSTSRDTGLHLLIDVGATTLDVSGFQLFENDDEDDNYSILVSEVEKLGANMLHLYRVKQMHDALDFWLTKAYNDNDLIEAVPESLQSYIPNFEEIRENLKNNDCSFKVDCQGLIRKMIDDLKKKRDPNSDRWEKGLPVFLLGGGRNHSFYKQLIKDIDYWMRQHFETNGLQEKDLVPPKKLAMNKDNDFYRFALAYGLSFPKDSIGNIRPKSVIKNIERRKSNKYKNALFISKEMT